MKRIIILFALLLSLTACSINASEMLTSASTPTQTPTPQLTTTPTVTPSPTFTCTVTPSPTATLSPVEMSAKLIPENIQEEVGEIVVSSGNQLYVALDEEGLPLVRYIEGENEVGGWVEAETSYYEDGSIWKWDNAFTWKAYKIPDWVKERFPDQIPILEYDLWIIQSQEDPIFKAAWDGGVWDLVPKQTNCMDSEANDFIKRNFLTDFGYQNLKEATDGMDLMRFYAGLENGPSWYFMEDLMIIGGYRFSLGNQPGFDDDDFAHCILSAGPNFEEEVVPIIIGIGNDGIWIQGTYFRQHADFRSPIQTIMNSAEEADEWIYDNRGLVILPLVVARFDKPNWGDDPLWHIGYEEMLPLMKNEQGYIMKYTKDPSLLGNTRDFPDGSGRPWGEPGNIEKLLRELTHEPGGDIGLFAWQITMFSK